MTMKTTKRRPRKRKRSAGTAERRKAAALVKRPVQVEHVGIYVSKTARDSRKVQH